MLKNGLKAITFVLAFSAALFLTACGDDMLPEYMVDQPQILAIQAEPPELTLGGPANFRLLVGGKGVSQEMDNEVKWTLDLERLWDQTLPSAYTQKLELNDVLWSVVLNGALPEVYQEPWFDFYVSAALTVNDKKLNGSKAVRINAAPAQKNPKITGVEIRFLAGDKLYTQILTEPGSRPIMPPGIIPDYMALIAITENPETLGNEVLIYRWKVSLAQEGEGKLYVYQDDDITQLLLGPDREASANKQAAVFSLKGENADEDFQHGTYDIYLILRDHAKDAQSRAEDRLGLDFFYFTMVIP